MHLKIDGKHDLLTIFLPEDKNKTQLSLSSRAREVADEVSQPILVTSQTCDLPSNVVLDALKTKIFVKKREKPVANVRKMLLMKDRSFLYELRAYLIYVKVGVIEDV